MILVVLKSPSSRTPPHLDLSDGSSWVNSGQHFGQECHTGDVSFSGHQIRRHTILVSPRMGGDHFNCFMVESPEFLHYKGALCPVWVIHQLEWGVGFETAWISSSLSILYPVGLASVAWISYDAAVTKMANFLILKSLLPLVGLLLQWHLFLIREAVPRYPW